VRGEICTAVAQPAAASGEDQLRADTVGRRSEQPLAVERMQACEAAEAARSGRLDSGPKAVDDGAGGRQRDPCLCIAALGAQDGQCTYEL